MDLLMDLDPHVDWPVVSAGIEPALRTAAPDVIDEQAANVGLVDGERALLDRRSCSAILASNRSSDDGRMIHPFLTVVATVFAWWRGHHAFHAGAFMNDRAAWAVLGGRGSGKSSQLAALALRGCRVLSDDLLVLKGLTAFAGPRCIDLRPDAAAALRLGHRTDRVRGGERLRPRHQGAPAEVELQGLIFLSWAEAGPELRPLRPVQRLERLASQMSFPSRQNDAVLRIAELPTWELRRPRAWHSIEDAARLLGSLAS